MQRLSSIVDSSGQPIVVKESLHEEQSAKIGAISTEYENHPSGGLVPRKLANILKDAEQGDLTAQCDLFEDMEEKDGHILADMSKRKLALNDLDWDIVPPRNPDAKEKAIAEEVKEWVLDEENLESYFFDMADAIGKAYSMLEMKWQDNGGIMLPELTHRPPRWFTTDEDNRDKLLLRNSGGKGDELWAFGWVKHVHKAKSGYIARAGLHRSLAWPFLFKNYSIRDLAEFCEIYGIPARIGTYPSGAGDNEKMTLLRAVVGIGHNAAGIMPEGMMIDFKEAAKGASDPFQFMINWCESVQSKIILGGTLTSTAENTGLGSNLGEIHNEIRKDLLASDAKKIAGTLTRDYIWPIVALNFQGIDPKRAPRFKFITEEAEELNKRAERDKTLHDIGIKLKAEEVQKIYGDEYELVETKPTKTNDTNGTDKAALAAAKAGDGSTELDGVVDKLVTETQSQLDQLYSQIKQLLDEVETMEEFQDRLVEAFSFLDPEELAGVIQMGLATAELAGRYEVSENG